MSRDTIYQQLRGHLAYLKLAAAAEALPAHLEAARQSQLGHTQFLEELLQVEVEATETRRWNSRMRFANFPTAWQLEDYATSPPSPPSMRNSCGNSQQAPTSPTRPTCCTYGPPGVGKTMLAVILGRAAVDGGHRVYYTTAADLAARCPNSRPRRPLGRNHAVLLRPGSSHSRRTGISAHARRGRRLPVPGHLPPLPERIGHPHHQPQRRVVGRHLLRLHNRCCHAGPAPAPKRRVHHLR